MNKAYPIHVSICATDDFANRIEWRNIAARLKVQVNLIVHFEFDMVDLEAGATGADFNAVSGINFMFVMDQ